MTPYPIRLQSGSLCGRHAINSLLQGPFVTEVDLSEIARELDDAERALMLSEGAGTADALRYMQEESFNVVSGCERRESLTNGPHALKPFTSGPRASLVARTTRGTFL